jgi:hypothetical protein
MVSMGLDRTQGSKCGLPISRQFVRLSSRRESTSSWNAAALFVVYRYIDFSNPKWLPQPRLVVAEGMVQRQL